MAAVKVYQLYVKVDGKWTWLKTIHAKTHPEALRKASGSLEAQHHDKPIRLEQDECPPPPPPPDSTTH